MLKRQVVLDAFDLGVLLARECGEELLEHLHLHNMQEKTPSTERTP